MRVGPAHVYHLSVQSKDMTCNRVGKGNPGQHLHPQLFLFLLPRSFLLGFQFLHPQLSHDKTVLTYLSKHHMNLFLDLIKHSLCLDPSERHKNTYLNLNLGLTLMNTQNILAVFSVVNPGVPGSKNI